MTDEAEKEKKSQSWRQESEAGIEAFSLPPHIDDHMERMISKLKLIYGNKIAGMNIQ
jgi:hypothetical protein